MVPANFVLLEALPLTPSGKIDRRALPDPEVPRLASTPAYVPPRTEVERTIAAIWQEVLHIEQVGTQHNFFDLGGHSLLLAQVHSKLRRALDASVSMIDLFQHPTISALAKHLTQHQGEQPAVQPAHDRAETRRVSLERQRAIRQQRRAL
jgi:acyl carrier protein